MERPLDIAFHNLQPSPSLETEIRRRVARLEDRFGRLTACRVSVEALHQQHETGNLYEVHITLSVPGRDLVVSREPHRAKERRAKPDVYACVRDAFGVAERQLEAFKGKLRTDTSSPTGSALSGQVTELPTGTDYGFVRNSHGTNLYFHRDSVTNGKFEDLKVGDPVHFVEEEGSAGPVATKVRVAVADQG